LREVRGDITSRFRLALVISAVFLALLFAFISAMSEMVISARDPWTAGLAAELPIFGVPLAALGWWKPRFGFALYLTIVLATNLACALPTADLQILSGCARNFCSFGYVAAVLLAGNAAVGVRS
jgi:hypothetical protein